MIRSLSLTSLAVAATLVMVGSATAQDKMVRRAKVASHRAVVLAEISSARPLTVQKRSFLDPGNVVAPNSGTPEYVAANTTDLVPVYSSFAPSRFGESTLPGRFDLPNNGRYEQTHSFDFSPF